MKWLIWVIISYYYEIEKYINFDNVFGIDKTKFERYLRLGILSWWKNDFLDDIIKIYLKNGRMKQNIKNTKNKN